MKAFAPMSIAESVAETLSVLCILVLKKCKIFKVQFDCLFSPEFFIVNFDIEIDVCILTIPFFEGNMFFSHFPFVFAVHKPAVSLLTLAVLGCAVLICCGLGSLKILTFSY